MKNWKKGSVHERKGGQSKKKYSITVKKSMFSGKYFYPIREIGAGFMKGDKMVHEAPSRKAALKWISNN